MGGGAFTTRLLVFIGIFAMPGLAAAAEASLCASYAEEAAREAARAEKFACAFHGPRWATDIEAHRAWCRGVTEATVRAEAEARSKDLRLCMCRWYADEAAAQAAMNAAHRCHFTGPRWTPDRSAHYRWCVLAEAPLATLESEIKTRGELLAKCVGR